MPDPISGTNCSTALRDDSSQLSVLAAAFGSASQSGRVWIADLAFGTSAGARINCESLKALLSPVSH